MTDIHIDDFCKDVAQIILRLYKTFPQKSDLYVEDIIGYHEPDEYGLHSERHMACLGAMLWLADEGYLRYGEMIRQEAVDQCILTKKTFTRLNTAYELVFSSDDENEAAPQWMKDEKQLYVNQIRSAVGSGSSLIVNQIIKHFIAADQ